MSAYQEVLALVEDWASRNDQILKAEIKRLKVGEKGGGQQELFFSVKSRVYAKMGTKIGMDLSFLTYGRFRDMGAGRKAKFESQATNRQFATRSKGRKPAKWYSKPFYGRLHALMGIVSANLQETTIQTIKEISSGPQ
ncbi:MAG: hypothetical protein ACO1OF_16505 [Adhaeribacter sp.]